MKKNKNSANLSSLGYCRNKDRWDKDFELGMKKKDTIYQASRQEILSMLG